MASPGGYSVTPGLYRVPDLVTEEQFIKYMKDVYAVDITFTHPGEKPDAVVNRALGGTDETTTPPSDPVLQAFNTRDWSSHGEGALPIEVEEVLSEEKPTSKRNR